MYDLPRTIPIKEIVIETPHVKTFKFDYSLGAKPGQFVNLWIPRVNEKPMSIAYADDKEFWVTMFAVGPFSKTMHTLKVGDLVGVRGPYGKPFSFGKGDHLVMMAGGYGAAPLYFLTLEAVKQDCTVDFVIGARSKEHLLYIDRIQNLPNVKLHIATDDGSVGQKGYNTMILEQLIQNQKGNGSAESEGQISSSKKVDGSGEAKSGNQALSAKEAGNFGQTKSKSFSQKPIDCVYACGPELMMKRISDICFENGISAQLSVERYMKCGFGVCGQCCVDDTGERMCKEGPVVSNEHARNLPEFGKYHRDGVGKVHIF